MTQLDVPQRAFRAGVPNCMDSLASCLAANYAGILAFIAVATEGSFIRAGERLGIGRSAVSRSIQRLEDSLSTRLFRRTTRNTSLTTEGERFFQLCSIGVSHIVGAVNDMLELRDGPPRGQLRVASSAGFGRNVVAPLLLKFSDAYPDIAVELVLDDKPADFGAGNFDVAFRDGYLEDSSIIAKQLVPMVRMVCASPAYVQGRGLPASPEALTQHDCINLRLSNGRLQPWEFHMMGRTISQLPASRLTFNDADLVLHAVLDGRGIAQMPIHQVWRHVARGELRAALAPYAPQDGGHHICYPSRQHLPVRSRAFIDFMTEAIRELDLTGRRDASRAMA
ncbi:LysR family transcriptional regulator [Cupriavidus pauculus]|uniref:LysR family transcriptional regulator n=1 Tax=Cupriavidus pauculus TaxID=82633 RepID=A0A2N5C5K2_9BURK|nr:LysR family transcriptional regulator [Cupriavidus pauculus]PLP97509.1 LysR family transcriptional regulator [Cupriavidus pauculus]